MVLVQFEVVLNCFDWFGLVLMNFCIKEMMKFQRSCYQFFFQNPCFCFDYKLSYNHPNSVIPVGREP